MAEPSLFSPAKDVGRWHWDFNASALLAGREAARGLDRNVQLALSFTRALKGPLEIIGEVYGNSRLNPDSPGFASTLWALSYTVSPRLVLDGGNDEGFTRGAPRKRVFAGVTYAVGNFYSALKHRRHSAG